MNNQDNQDIEFTGDRKSFTNPVAYPDKPSAEMVENALVTLTKEDVSWHWYHLTKKLADSSYPE